MGGKKDGWEGLGAVREPPLLSPRERGGGWFVWTADYADFRRWAMMPRAVLPRWLSVSGLRVLSELGWAGLKDGREGLGAVREPPLLSPRERGGGWFV